MLCPHRENYGALVVGDASGRGVLGEDSAWTAGAWESTLGTQEVTVPPGEKEADTCLP